MNKANNTGEWVSVEDELPQKGLRVRVKIDLRTHGEHSKFEREMHRMNHNGKWFDYDKWVTHWMPLPSPPNK